MLAQLSDFGYDLHATNHAAAIVTHDFAPEMAELASVLAGFRLPAEELISSGGGEAASTQRLRRQLAERGWQKHSFEQRFTIDGVARQSISHEIDHVRKGANGTIALEIEWNNKDPFFDRDLENFQRLHAFSAISFGVVITRGPSLQSAMIRIVQDTLDAHGVTGEDGLGIFDMKERTARQRRIVERSMAAQGIGFSEAFAKAFVADKFGAATTHWAKLMDRVSRGVGNPCPLVLIGIPASRVAAEAVLRRDFPPDSGPLFRGDG